MLLFTAPTIDVVPLLTSNISVWDLHDESRRAAAPVELRSHDVPCELAPADVRLSCDGHVDVASADAFECHVRVDNRDSWPCVRRRSCRAQGHGGCARAGSACP